MPSPNLDELFVLGDLIAYVLVAPDQKLQHLAGAAGLGALQFTLQAANHVDHFIPKQIFQVQWP